MVKFWEDFKKENKDVKKPDEYLKNLKSRYAEAYKKAFKDDKSDGDDDDEFGESMASISLMSKHDV